MIHFGFVRDSQAQWQPISGWSLLERLLFVMWARCKPQHY
jgi:hypothetical protein